MSERRTYVVVGATGKTGREVERHLTSHGHDVRAVARRRGVGVDDAVAFQGAFEHADGAFVLVPFNLETTTSTSLRDWARTALAGVSA